MVALGLWCLARGRRTDAAWLGFVAAEAPSLLLSVQTKHSAEAFAACQWYLQQIKRTVPIWKNPIWRDE